MRHEARRRARVTCKLTALKVFVATRARCDAKRLASRVPVL
ncbi:hypothetical protein SAMN05446935_0889 [Burkholderia sp. YR290]|jgi:hypothetical protein|nr:hypothetical protein PMI06_004357 [Burkholderia sp. BT03]SKC78236.1 hypothetical protein SAMN05446934_3454 [Paraburkholderia hospita]SKC97330.1 hypothetical protein SAMN06266956_7479 [Paraburkholderia hospita]SOE55580.1 hypothetical protein SAMN05446935_0889 [Burkholderia sp. YR290]